MTQGWYLYKIERFLKYILLDEHPVLFPLVLVWLNDSFTLESFLLPKIVIMSTFSSMTSYQKVGFNTNFGFPSARSRYTLFELTHCGIMTQYGD